MTLDPQPVHVTNYPGKYTNDDTIIDLVNNSTGDSIPDGIEDNDFQVSVSGNTIDFLSLDYGGSITVRVSTIVDGIPIQKDLTIPVDADANGLPDAWERLYSGIALDPDGDIDVSAKNVFHGDGLSNREECRGIMYDSAYNQTVVGPDAVYQTPARIPSGNIVFFRPDPTRKDLFVKYTGFFSGAYPYSIGNPDDPIPHPDNPFALGNAFENAGIKVHALNLDTVGFISPGEKNIDVILITNDPDATKRDNFGVMDDGHIDKEGRRYWEWDTKAWVKDFIGTYNKYPDVILSQKIPEWLFL